MLEMARQKGALGASLEARVLLHVAEPGIARQLRALQGVREEILLCPQHPADAHTL